MMTVQNIDDLGNAATQARALAMAIRGCDTLMDDDDSNSLQKMANDLCAELDRIVLQIEHARRKAA